MKKTLYLLMVIIAMAIPAQAATQFDFLLSQVRTSTTSLVGGKAYFYAPGTSTLGTVWLDAGETTIAANPYTLDANGTAQLYGSGIYRVVIKDASGATKYDRNNVSVHDMKHQVISPSDIITGGPWVDARTQAVGNGVANDAAALQSIANAIVATGRVTWIDLAGRTYKVNSGLTLRCDLVGIRNGKLDFSGMTSGSAITITGKQDGQNPFRQVGQVMTGVEVIGPGKTSSVDGLVFDASALGGPSHISLSDVNVHEFNNGHSFKNHAYAITFNNCDVYNCTNCVTMLSGYTDYGERISYIGCTLYDSTLALNMGNANGALHLTDTSIDYNQGIATITGGRVFLTDCHIEGGNYPTGSPINISGNGGTFKMSGGWLLMTVAAPHDTTSMVQCNTTAGGGGGAWFTNVFMHNLSTTSGYFATGTGNVFVTGTSSYDVNLSSTLLSWAANNAMDGGFEGSDISDFAYIANDTAPITDRFTGQNVQLAQSNSYANSGVKSLSINKTFGAGSSAMVRIAVPVRPGAKMAFRFYYTKPGSQTGTTYFGWYFARAEGGDASGVPIFAKGALHATTAVFTSTPVGWTAWSVPWLNGTGTVPPGTTHLLLEINLHDMNAGTIYLDDLLVTEM